MSLRAQTPNSKLRTQNAISFLRVDHELVEGHDPRARGRDRGAAGCRGRVRSLEEWLAFPGRRDLRAGERDDELSPVALEIALAAGELGRAALPVIHQARLAGDGVHEQGDEVLVVG